ncbi:Ig-like domain repeat protein, partial [uncultured Methanobrevibacter sp.]|uniref:Ig-like domain repeat protein n=1 Tax=uncultured Methanobrevibacter sp. TaxID=253161 RepID=UPI0026244E63
MKSKGLIKKISLLFFIILVLCIIPSSFAIDSDSGDLAISDSSDNGIVEDLTIDSQVAVEKSSQSLGENAVSSGDSSSKIQTNLSDDYYNDIKSAIESSDEEFTIYLGEGTYSNIKSADYTLAEGESNTNLSFDHKYIVFEGAGQDKTFIDGTETDWLFNFSSSKISFKGISFVNATSFSSVYGEKCAPVIYSSYSNLTMVNCTVANNKFSGGSFYSQSPVYFEGSSWSPYELNIADCLFANNFAYRGGALYIASAYGNIVNTDFIANSADNGGAVHLNFNNHNITFDNDNFINNTAGGAAAINSYYGGNFSLFNCKFINNTADEGSAAVYSKDYNSQSTQVYIYLKNNTFINNMAGDIESNMITEGGTYDGPGPNVIDLEGNAVINVNVTEITYGDDEYLHIEITDSEGYAITDENIEIILNGTHENYYIYESFENGSYDLSLKDYAIGVYNVTITLVSDFYSAMPKKTTVRIRGDYDFTVFFDPDHVNLHEGESYIVNGIVVDEYNEETSLLNGLSYWIMWETYEGGHRSLTGHTVDGSKISFDSSILEMIPTKVYDVEVEIQLGDYYYDYYTATSGHIYINVSKVVPENLTDLDIIYVDAVNGNDETGNGEESNPVQSLIVGFNINDELGGGRTIFVKEGNYEMSTYIVKNDVKVIGESQAGVILSQTSGTKGMFELAEGLNVEFNNMTFINGFNNPIPGAAFSNYYASRLVLNNSEFYNNTGCYGGVINNNDQGTVIIDNCNFHDNLALDGGVITASEGNIFIYNSNFTNNKAQRLYGEILRNGTGGALEIYGDTNTVIVNCLFEGNQAPEEESTDGGGAIALSVTGSTLIANSTFINNYAGRRGGAIWAVYGNIDIYGCVFINNTAKQGGSVLATEYNEGAIVNLTNSVIITNDTGGAVIYVLDESESNVTANNNWWGSNSAPSLYNADVSSRILMTLTNDEDDNIVVALSKLSDGGIFTGYLPVREVIFTPTDKFDAAVLEMTSNTLVVEYHGDITSDAITATIDKQTLVLNYNHYPEIDSATTVEDVNALIGSPAIITATVVAGDVKINNGTLSFYINNELIDTVDVVEGIASTSYTSLSVGEFNIKAVFNGDNTYKPSTGEASLNVFEQKISKFDVSKVNLMIGENFIAQLIDNENMAIANKTVKITVIPRDGETSQFNQTTDDNGSISLELDAGSYTINLLFNADDDYLGCKLTVSLIVSKYDTAVSISNENGSDEVIVKLVDADGQALADKNISLSIRDGHGNLNVLDLVTKEDGTNKIALEKGNYFIFASFAGDDYYSPSNETLEVSISDSDSPIDNGTDTNGTDTNETDTNGTDTNGTDTNGTDTNGTDDNGTDTNITVLDGKAIQEMIDNANPGDIITLGNHDYVNVSDVNITKNITIVGSENTTVTGAGDGKAIFNIVPISQGGPEAVTISGLTILANDGEVIVQAVADNGTSPNLIDVANINILNNTIAKANEDVYAESVTVLKLDSERGSLAPSNDLVVSGNTLDSGMAPFDFDVTSATSGSDAYVPAGGNIPEKLASEILCANMTTNAINTVLDGRNGEYFNFQLVDSNGKA